MKHTCLLSENAKDYLCCFYQTLDAMVQGMTAAGLTQSISHNFIVQMLPHHRAAIQMSNNVLRFTEHPAVRRLAQQSVQERTQAADLLEDALGPSGQRVNPQQDLRLYQRRVELICRDMYAKMSRAPEGNRLAALYLRQTLPLRAGAVRMAETALKYDISAELAPILRAGAAQQRREIAQARALLSRLECQR